jgi:hypothetical protein
MSLRMPPDLSRLVLVVVGSGLEAELEDRQTAYAVARALNESLDDAVDGPGGTLRSVVCTDLWYLNTPQARTAPTIAVGGPERNALTAHLTTQLARPIGVDGQWIVQTPEPEGTGLEDLVACLWGVSGDETARAVGEFIDHLLDDFVESVVRKASGG